LKKSKIIKILRRCILHDERAEHFAGEWWNW
jgi:hypothetical protein